MDDSEIKTIIKEISSSMAGKGYNPVTQIVGYLITNDLGYIPDFDDNRNKMTMLDRNFLLENTMSDYLK